MGIIYINHCEDPYSTTRIQSHRIHVRVNVGKHAHTWILWEWISYPAGCFIFRWKPQMICNKTSLALVFGAQLRQVREIWFHQNASYAQNEGGSNDLGTWTPGDACGVSFSTSPKKDPSLEEFHYKMGVVATCVFFLMHHSFPVDLKSMI